jgi:pseudouridine synthase
LHKPRGVVCSTVAERGAPAVTSLLPEPYRGWWSVGRLDKDSEGLLLFADDPAVAQRLMDPGALAKTYVVTVEGFPDDESLAPIRAGGLVLDGRILRPVDVERIGKAPRGGTRYRVVLHEGVNREIRRLLRGAGHHVRRLVRVAVGPIELADLAAGSGRELSPEEVARVVSALGAVGPGRAPSPRRP